MAQRFNARNSYNSFRRYNSYKTHNQQQHQSQSQQNQYQHANDDYKSPCKWIKKPNTATDSKDKQYYRQSVWNYMERHNIALFPRPVYHRIPNFVGADKAAINLLKLDCFHKANIVKVNPDKPQQMVRYLCLKMHKILLVPTPQLRSNGLLNEIVIPSHLKDNTKTLEMAATRKGLHTFGHLLSLQELATSQRWRGHKIDVCMVGSVVVDRSNGYRIGKGEGYADMEIAVLNELGLIDANTKFIATVHDCQVYQALDAQLFDETDVRLDYIVTPTQIIEIKKTTASGGDGKALPYKIDWSRLNQERLNKMPVLKILRQRQQQQQQQTKDESEENEQHLNVTKRKMNDTDKNRKYREKSSKVSRW